MSILLNILCALSMISVLPAFVASIYSSHLLSKYLRTAHPAIWEKIAPIPGAEPSLSSPFARFVSQRAYRQINDPVLQRLGDSAYRLLYLAVGVFLLLVLTSLAL